MLSEKRRIEILRELHQMKLQLDSCCDKIRDINSNTLKSSYLERNGSIRGKKNLVQKVVLMYQRDCSSSYSSSSTHTTGVVVYLTSCGVLRRAYDKCKVVTRLLEAHRIKFEVRDLNISCYHVEELIEKLGLSSNHRDLVFESLPLVYTDGFFLGNERTIVELNDKKILETILQKFKTSNNQCDECGNRGYVVCRICHGSRRHHSATSSSSSSDSDPSENPFGLQLRCSSCDQNGIAKCRKCFS